MFGSSCSRYFHVVLGIELGVFGEVINADHQMQWVTENIRLLRLCGTFEAVYTLLRASCKWMESEEYPVPFDCSDFEKRQSGDQMSVRIGD